MMRYMPYIILKVLTKNQIIIPDNMAAIRQRMKSCHICSNARRIWLVVLVEDSFVAKTGLCSLFSIIIGSLEIDGKFTEIAGLSQLFVPTAEWFWRQWCIELLTQLSSEWFSLEKKLNSNLWFQRNSTQESFRFTKGWTTWTFKMMKKKQKALHRISLICRSFRVLTWELIGARTREKSNSSKSDSANKLCSVHSHLAFI